jgi:conjugal transfer pilin signal peptidase TrbI
MRLTSLESVIKPNPVFVLQRQKIWLKRFWPLFLIPLAWWLTQNIGYSINLTGSLPQKLWLIVFNKQPTRGDYILFKAPVNSEVPAGTTVIKQVLGIPYDMVLRMNQDFFINGQYVVTAKKHSLQGEPLKPGPSGVLPDKQYYVASHHKDSFDSRYEKMGWINASQIIGVAYPLW